MKRGKGIRLTFCKGDAFVIFCVFLLSILIGVMFFVKTGNDEGSVAVIYRDGTKVQELPLNRNTDVLIQNKYTNKIVVKDKEVAIVESDCPGRDCVHSGWIGGKGRSLVCLPNRVEIRIEGEQEAEVDFIVR